MEDKNYQNNYFASVLKILLPVTSIFVLFLLFFLRPRGQFSRKASFYKTGPNQYTVMFERSNFIDTNGEEVLLSLEGHILNSEQVNKIAQQNSQNSMAALSTHWSFRTWNRAPRNESSLVTPTRVSRQDSHLYERDDKVVTELTEESYKVTKESLRRTKSASELKTVNEESTSLLKQTSQNMIKTTEIGYDLCEGKLVKIDKNTNFKVLDKFLQIGEDWNFSWKGEWNFPKKNEIGNMKKWLVSEKLELTFDRLHGLPVDAESQTIAKKHLDDKRFIEGFVSGAYKVDEPFSDQSKYLQRVCFKLSSLHNQNLLALLKEDPNFPTALEWVWKNHHSNLSASNDSTNRSLCVKFESFESIDVQKLTADDLDPLTLSDVSKQLVGINQTACINESLSKKKCKVSFSDGLNPEYNLHAYGDQEDYPILKNRNTVLLKAVEFHNKQMTKNAKEIGYTPAISKEQVMEFLANDDLCLDKGQISLQKEAVPLTLKIGQQDHVYNKNIRQAAKLRYDTKPISQELSAAVHVSNNGHNIKKTQMNYQETRKGYVGGLWEELRCWAKDGVNSIMQDSDPVIQEIKSKIESAYMDGAEDTIKRIQNKALFIKADSTVYRFNKTESHKWYHANINGIMSKNIFQDLKQAFNRMKHPPRVTEVLLKGTDQKVLLSETNFGKHTQESLDQDAVNALQSVEILLSAMDALAEKSTSEFREALSNQRKDVVASIEASCIDINPFLSEPITASRIERLKNPPRLAAILFEDELKKEKISVEDIPETKFDEKLYEYMDRNLQITQIGQDFPRFYPPLNTFSIEEKYQSRMGPDGFTDSTEAISDFNSRIEQAKTKNKEGPLSYYAYHNATNPFFSTSEKRVFYDQIIAAKLGIPENTVATIVQNGNASNIQEFVEKVKDKSFEARFIGEKKTRFVTQIVDKFNANAWPEKTVPSSNTSSVYL